MTTTPDSSQSTLELPALDGRLPLGFLAACGVQRLLNSDGGPPVRLSWCPVRAIARLVITGERGDGSDSPSSVELDAVVTRLHDVAVGISDDGLLPGGVPGFPGAAPKGWPRNDGMRVPREHFASSVAAWRSLMSATADRWVPAMVTDQAVDGKGCVAITPFAAPSGQQTFITMFDKALRMVQGDRDLVRQALIGWRRRDGVTGEYLDHHVLQSAADRSDGRSDERGVPGATWLALMALPRFPVWSAGATPLAGGWQSVGRRRALAWPLWQAPLDEESVASLVAHPGLRLAAGADGRLACDISSLEPLSVFRVCAAERRQISGRTFAGVLTPIPIG